MKKKIALFLAAITLLIGPVFASADHSTEGIEASQSTTKVMTATPALSSGASVEQMEMMIKLLTQLLDLLKHQAEHAEADAHGHDDATSDDDATFDDDANDDHDDEDGHDDADDDHDEDEEDHH